MEDVEVDLLPLIPLLESLLHRQRPHRLAQLILDESTSQREPLVAVLVHKEDAHYLHQSRVYLTIQP